MSRAGEKGDRVARFHAREGWYFERTEDGGVRLVASGEEVELDADTWASAVASVTKAGEDTHTFHAAKALHDNEISNEALGKVLWPEGLRDDRSRIEAVRELAKASEAENLPLWGNDILGVLADD